MKNRVLRVIGATCLTLMMLFALAGCNPANSSVINEDDYTPEPTQTLTEEPVPTPEITPEPGPIELISPPHAAAVELYASDADLSGAPNVVVEPDSMPYNLGGWTAGNTVVWEFDIPFDTNFEIGILYSRPPSEWDDWGTVLLYEGDSTEPISITFQVPRTSNTPNDWSAYQYLHLADLDLVSGPYRMEMLPGGEDNPLQMEHFINLRYIYIDGENPATSLSYDELSQEHRMEILGYDAMDVGNPWRDFPSEYVYGFLAWYANDQYGLELTAEDVRNAVGEVSEAADHDGVGEHPLSYMSRFYHVCVYYELYPTQEMREGGIECMDEGMPFGQNPMRAKDDTDEIEDSYYSN